MGDKTEPISGWPLKLEDEIPVHSSTFSSTILFIQYSIISEFQYIPVHCRISQIRVQLNSSTFQYISRQSYFHHACFLFSPWLKKFIEIGILKGCRLTQFYLLMLKILSPWLKKILKIGILKGYRLTQFFLKITFLIFQYIPVHHQDFPVQIFSSTQKGSFPVHFPVHFSFQYIPVHLRNSSTQWPPCCYVLRIPTTSNWSKFQVKILIFC